MARPARPWPDPRPAPRSWPTSSATKRPSSSCRSSAAGSTRASAPSTSPCGRTRTTISGCGPHCDGFVFYRNIVRSGITAAAPTAFGGRTADAPGILQVFRKLRPQLLNRPTSSRSSTHKRIASKPSTSRRRSTVGAIAASATSLAARRHLGRPSWTARRGGSPGGKGDGALDTTRCCR